MRVAFFDTHKFERPIFENENRDRKGEGVESARPRHQLFFFETRLTEGTASLARGCGAVCSFVNDRLNAETLSILAREGVRLVALRSAGFNHVDLEAAAELGIRVLRVPAYSPHAVAEHAVALLLALNRKIPKASSRVRELNFSLDGLVGFDLYKKTVGVVGLGRIGRVFADIMRGFGCRVIGYDKILVDALKNPEASIDEPPHIEFVPLEQLYRQADVISLHLPLTPETHHMISKESLDLMKRGVILINTGRGALIDSAALIQSLKSGLVGGAGLDVYEEEENIFSQDLSDQVLQDDTLARLLSFPNVLITAHQAFLTTEALHNIAATTLNNISEFEKDEFRDEFAGSSNGTEVGGSHESRMGHPRFLPNEISPAAM